MEKVPLEFKQAQQYLFEDENYLESESEGLQLCKRLSQLPFWCGNETIHLENPYYHEEFCCETHVTGLPTHPATKEEMPLTPYQVEFVNKILSEITKLGENASLTEIVKRLLDKLRDPNLFHVNKGRQMGFTEIVLRLIKYLCFSRYAGSKIGIIAATNGKLAKKDLRRFSKLFKRIPQVVEQWVVNSTMKLVNGTEIEAFPASEEALTGDTDYKCIFMDESAKWKLVDDTPTFNSILPIVRTNGADLFLVSTPKGPIKMFYKIHKDPEDFIKFEYDIWRTEGNLYTKSQIETMLASEKEDPDQEYLCKFTIGEDSILGSVTNEDRGTGWREWDAEEDDDPEEYNGEW